MARRNRPNLQAQLAAYAPTGNCPAGWGWHRNELGGWDCIPPSFAGTYGGGYGAGSYGYMSNPGPVDPFGYEGPDLMISMPVDPFARARLQHARMVAAKRKRTARYNTMRRLLGL